MLVPVLVKCVLWKWLSLCEVSRCFGEKLEQSEEGDFLRVYPGLNGLLRGLTPDFLSALIRSFRMDILFFCKINACINLAVGTVRQSGGYFVD